MWAASLGNPVHPIWCALRHCALAGPRAEHPFTTCTDVAYVSVPHVSDTRVLASRAFLFRPQPHVVSSESQTLRFVS